MSGQQVVQIKISGFILKSQQARKLIESVGAELWYLLAYSPDLNPIEKMLSKIKSILRTLKARTKETLIYAIAKALEMVKVF